MKIGVIGANGKAGKLIVQEALNRGLDVTVVVRRSNESAATQAIVKDATDLTAADLQDFDVVITAVGGWTEDTVEQILATGEHLIDILSGTDTRLLVVGGAGTLYVDEANTMLEETPGFPDSWKPISGTHRKLLEKLRKTSNLNWTYLSPAADFQAEGARTGTYQLSGDRLVTNAAGESAISYADYAIAMVDEAVNPTPRNRERISVCSK